MKPPSITQLEMTEADIETAEKVARRLRYTQTAYTSTSAIWGLYCLPDRPLHRGGVIFKTAEFGLVFLQDMEDMHCEDIRDAQAESEKLQKRNNVSEAIAFGKGLGAA